MDAALPEPLWRRAPPKTHPAVAWLGHDGSPPVTEDTVFSPGWTDPRRGSPYPTPARLAPWAEADRAGQGPTDHARPNSAQGKTAPGQTGVRRPTHCGYLIRCDLYGDNCRAWYPWCGEVWVSGLGGP